MSPHAVVDSRDDLVSTTTSSDRTMERATAVMTTLTSPASLTSTDPVVHRIDRFADEVADEVAVETLLAKHLARRRALRRARRELAVQQARQEHELLIQRTLFGAGLTHLR